MSEIKILPELKSCLLPLSQEEKIELERSLIEEGCRDSLVLWGDILIDGHNRFEICKKHNIPYKTIQKDFKNIDEVKIWILKNQLARRNLNNVVKIEIAEKVMEGRKKLAKEKQLSTLKQNTVNATVAETENTVNIDTTETAGKQEKININKEIGDMAGVSERTVARYNTIKKHAPEEVKEKVKNGEMSINQAYGYAKTYEYLENEMRDKEPQEKTKQENFIEHEFKKIEEETAIQKNIHNAVYKILTTEITDEYLDIWISGLGESYIETLEEDLDRAIEEYKKIKEFYKNFKKIRRLK